MKTEKSLRGKSIGVFIFSLGPGGAERFVSYFLEYLFQQDVTVHLILMEKNIRFPLHKDIKLHILGKSRSNEKGIIKFISLPFLTFKYAKLTKELKIDYSFSLLTRPNLINVLSRTLFKNQARLVLGVRSFTSLTYSYGNVQSKINKRLIASIYPNSDLIIGNSFGNSEDLVNNFNITRDKVITIQNPIDLEKIKDIVPINNFFDEDYFNIITVGRLIALKNQMLIIRAISDLPKVRLYLIGLGELIDEIEKLIEELDLQDRVFLLGHQTNPFKYLKSADLFVFSSNHEGFPNVLLEAMACGLPILSTNCDSGPNEILGYQGESKEELIVTKNGILIPVNHLELMKKGLKYFMKNDDYYTDCQLAVTERVKDFEKSSILQKYADAIFQ
ncbi:MAG: glycosyltransferase [Croceivirga sp.]